MLLVAVRFSRNVLDPSFGSDSVWTIWNVGPLVVIGVMLAVKLMLPYSPLMLVMLMFDVAEERLTPSIILVDVGVALMVKSGMIMMIVMVWDSGPLWAVTTTT